MAFDAHVLKVMISSPGDTADEVAAVTTSLHGWNGSRAESAQTILLPRFWKTDAVPQLTASGGQSVINAQLLDTADIVIALFDSRLGQETDSAVSGTAEEIERAVTNGTPVHVWFSDEPVDRRKIDLQESARLEKFRKELEDKGLLGVHSDLSDLAFKVREAIEHDISQLGLGAPSVVRKGEHALPRFHVERTDKQVGTKSDGSPRTVPQYTLVLENKSQNVGAESVTFDVGDQLQHSIIGKQTDPFDLLPVSSRKWTLALDWGSPDAADIDIRWTEGGKGQHLTQSIDLH